MRNKNQCAFPIGVQQANRDDGVSLGVGIDFINNV